jgi:PAS domain S-box-containing protein
VRHLSASGKALAKTAKILGRSAYDIRTPVDDETYKEMLSYRAKRFEGLYELTLGGVPRAATEIIVKSLGIGEIYGAALHHGGELLGTAAVLTRRGREGPSLEILENFANVVAAALERKKAEEAIARRAEGFKIVNDLAIELAAAASTAEIYALTCRKLKDLTGAVAALTASYDEDADELVFNSVAAESKVLKRSTKILGRDVTKLRFPAERYAPSQMSSDRVVIFEGIPKKAYKVIPEKIGAVIEKTFNVGPVYELLLHHGGKLMGTAEVVMLRGSPPLSVDALETFAHVAAAALVNKQAEEAYRTSEERFKSLVDTMNEGFGIQDVDGVIAYVNDRFCDMVGYAREELVGRPATDFLDPPNARIMRDQTARREKSPGDNYDIVWTGKDGRRVHTIISPGALRDAEGRYVGTYATITDVTARKRAEERLKESEKRYKAIVKLAPDGITFVNPENVIVVASPTFAAALGYKPHELEGKSFAELMPPGEPPKGRAETGRRHQRRAAEYDVVLLHRDGSPKRLTLYSQPLTADDGGFVGTAKKIVAGP